MQAVPTFALNLKGGKHKVSITRGTVTEKKMTLGVQIILRQHNVILTAVIFLTPKKFECFLSVCCISVIQDYSVAGYSVWKVCDPLYYMYFIEMLQNYLFHR